MVRERDDDKDPHVSKKVMQFPVYRSISAFNLIRAIAYFLQVVGGMLIRVTAYFLRMVGRLDVMLGNDKTLLQDLMGRDLSRVKEGYWKHDRNPQSESQVKLKSKDWGKHKHIVDSDITKFEDWDDDPDLKDAKVSIDELQEKMYLLDGSTQSMDIAAKDEQY